MRSKLAKTSIETIQILQSRSSMIKHYRYPSKSSRSMDSHSPLVTSRSRYPTNRAVYSIRSNINHISSLGHSRNHFQIFHHRIHHIPSNLDRRPSRPYPYNQSTSRDDRITSCPHQNHPTRFRDDRRPFNSRRTYPEYI